jgi:hypothetical protein
VWLWPNLLSLDAPLVAVLWQVLFVRCFHAQEAFAPAVLLVSAVWLIYSADRLLDVWRGCGHRPRHDFCRRYWRGLLPVWAGVLAATAWLAWTALPEALFNRGLSLLAVVAVYFLAVHGWGRDKMWAKELAVAVLFALGATIITWTRLRTPADVLTILFFSCLCWINCVAIESWENADWESGQGHAHVGGAAALVGLAAVVLLSRQRPVLAGAEAMSALAFVLLDRCHPRFSADAVRVLADAALLSPILVLPLAGLAP